METLKFVIANWKTHLGALAIGAAGAYMGVDWLALGLDLVNVGWDFMVATALGLMPTGGA